MQGAAIPPPSRSAARGAPPAIVVVVTGAESTGKSTLAARLAAHFGAPLAAEFARTYAERVQRSLTAADVAAIAAGQREGEDEAIARAGPGGLAILDTDLVSTLVYARHYYGSAMPELEALVAARSPSLYLLCDTDVPWVGDPVRDADATRTAIQHRLVDALAAARTRVVSVSGSFDSRGRTADAEVRALLQRANEPAAW